MSQVRNDTCPFPLLLSGIRNWIWVEWVGQFTLTVLSICPFKFFKFDTFFYHQLLGFLCLIFSLFCRFILNPFMPTTTTTTTLTYVGHERLSFVDIRLIGLPCSSTHSATRKNHWIGTITTFLLLVNGYPWRGGRVNTRPRYVSLSR